MCEKSIIVIAGFCTVGGPSFMRGVIEARAWNAWTRNIIGFNISVVSRGVSNIPVAKQSISEESRLKVFSAVFTSPLVRFGNSKLCAKNIIWGPPRPMQCQTTLWDHNWQVLTAKKPCPQQAPVRSSISASTTSIGCFNYADKCIADRIGHRVHVHCKMHSSDCTMLAWRLILATKSMHQARK